jgi:hypothetical protein
MSDLEELLKNSISNMPNVMMLPPGGCNHPERTVESLMDIIIEDLSNTAAIVGYHNGELPREVMLTRVLLSKKEGRDALRLIAETILEVFPDEEAEDED